MPVPSKEYDENHSGFYFDKEQLISFIILINIFHKCEPFYGLCPILNFLSVIISCKLRQANGLLFTNVIRRW